LFYQVKHTVYLFWKHCLKTKQWLLVQHLPDSCKICTNFMRRMSFFSKSTLANVANLASIKSRDFGKFSKFGSVYKVVHFIYISTYFALIKWSSLPLPYLLNSPNSPVLTKLASTCQT
jgi:hypothetical protein